MNKLPLTVTLKILPDGTYNAYLEDLPNNPVKNTINLIFLKASWTVQMLNKTANISIINAILTFNGIEIPIRRHGKQVEYGNLMNQYEKVLSHEENSKTL